MSSWGQESYRSDAASPPKRFALTGPTTVLDPRVHAVRADLADVALAATVFAPHYAAAVPRAATRRSLILDAPFPDAAVRSEILAGEPFELFDLTGAWAWGRCLIDGSVGYALRDAIGPAAPALGVPPVRPMAAGAAMLVGTSRLPGGRSADGLDEGGLVFLAARRAGHQVARFLDLQARSAGKPLPSDTRPIAGDLMFSAEGAAIMLDDATAAMLTPTLDAVERRTLASLITGEAIGIITAHRRLS